MHTDEQAADQARCCRHKEGIILVTGPTGSGKTTTLYSAIRLIQSEGVNIVTVEDPVEYRLGENIVQVQVNEKAGLTFASALRSILRQDPDVVLIGEIRDQETAQIALQASLTGHLVLSTLHTNDAPNAVTRLIDMGMEAVQDRVRAAGRGGPAAHAPALCRLSRSRATEPLPERVARFIPAGTPLFRAVGCGECVQTGYRGRFSIMEVLTMNAEIERRIGAGGHRRADRRRRPGPPGMKSLWESGLRARHRGRVDAGGAAPGHRRAHEGRRRPRTRRGRTPADRRPGAGARDRGVPLRPASPPPHASPRLTPSLDFTHGPGAAGRARRARRRLGGRGRGAKVLLVEDEDQLRRVMKDLLEREGYIVAEARDGVQALDEVDRHAPDIIVLDLNLPGLDGYSVLQQLRSRPATRAIPVMVLTAKGDEDNEVRVFELGADDFLTKPFRARALSARLEAVLGRHRA